MVSAVVFAYHNVGVRCLSVLLAQNVDVRLVVTHEDAGGENIWFESVADLARQHDILVVTPTNPHDEEMMALLRSIEPDFLFSFYYRNILKKAILDIPKRGCYNMHGSLLPKYRGRVPVNWAIINGESESGATLHEMYAKADAGPIVDQLAVPILPNDTAQEVFGKVLVAAELVMHRSLPLLIKGSAKHNLMDLKEGSYYGGRKAEDGRIDWTQSAQRVHDLVRAVTHPYPGAFTDTIYGRLILWRTLLCDRHFAGEPALFVEEERVYARGGDGQVIRLLRGTLDGHELTATLVKSRVGQEGVVMLQ